MDIGDDNPDGQADTSDARADGPDALTQLLREQIDGRLQAEQAAAMWQERARNLEAENSRLQELLALPAHVEGPAHRRPWWQVWRRTQADGTGARRPAQD